MSNEWENYSQALNCHKTLAEAIFRLLFNRFIEEHELSDNLKLLAEGFLHNVNKDSWKLFVGQPDVEDFGSSTISRRKDKYKVTHVIPTSSTAT